jgi:hypothetical protein
MSGELIYEPDIADFVWVGAAGVAFSAIRYVSERTIFAWIHRRWGTHWKQPAPQWSKAELEGLKKGMSENPVVEPKKGTVVSENEKQIAFKRWELITASVNGKDNVNNVKGFLPGNKEYHRSVEEVKARNKSITSATKAAEAGWKAINWITFVIIGLYVSSSQPWFTDTEELWRGYPFKMTYGIKLFYLAELAWYVHSQAYLMMLESETGQKRTDFIMMSVHHCATLTLIAWSYWKHYTPIGCMILWVHDISDVFLETALFLKEHGINATLLDGFFAGLTISWFILRLVAFPFILVGSIVSTLYKVCPRAPEGLPGGSAAHITNVWQHFMEPFAQPMTCPYPHWYFMLLSILCVLHVIWFAMIVRMIIRALRYKGETRHDDIREQKDD